MTDPLKGTLERHTRGRGSLVPLITVLYNVPEILIFDSAEKINHFDGGPAVPGAFWLAFFIRDDVPGERTNEIISIIQNAVDGLDHSVWLFENRKYDDMFSFELNGDNTRTGELAEQIQRFAEHPVARGPELPPLRRDFAADAALDAELAAERNAMAVSPAPERRSTAMPASKHRTGPATSPAGAGTAPGRAGTVMPSPTSGTGPDSPAGSALTGAGTRAQALKPDPAPSLPGEGPGSPLPFSDPVMIREKFGLPYRGPDSLDLTPDSIPLLFRSDRAALSEELQKSLLVQEKALFITSQVVLAYLFDIPVEMATIEGNALIRFGTGRSDILLNHYAQARILIASGWEAWRYSVPVKNAVETDRMLVYLLGLWLPGIRREALAAARLFFMQPWSKIPLGNLRRELKRHGTLHREEIEFILADPGYYHIIERYRFRFGERGG